MKFFVMMDDFDGKSGLTAERLNLLIDGELKKEYVGCEVESIIPFYCNKRAEELAEKEDWKIVGGKVQDANFFLKEATYAVKDNEALISTKNTSDLEETMIKDPAFTTSYGFGQQILQALKLGKKKITLMLGETAANDGGAGAAVALGARFVNENGEEFVPTGGTLGQIAEIDMGGMDKRVKEANFTAVCKEENPLVGENGCAYKLSEKKGAKKLSHREELERNMVKYAEKTAFLGVNAEEKTTGAAGGLGYFVKAFLNGETVTQTERFIEREKIEEKIKNADEIICGEEIFDGKEKEEKYCEKIIKIAKSMNKNITVICAKNEVKTNIDYTVREIEFNDEEITNEKDNEFYFLKGIEQAVKDVKRK